MPSGRAGRSIAVALFGLLAVVVLLAASARISAWPGPLAVEALWGAVGGLLITAAALGASGSWRGDPLRVLAALGAMALAWGLHAVWRMRTVPEELRAVTFGGDVVQSCLALVLFAAAVLWASGTVGLQRPITTRGPPAR